MLYNFVMFCTNVSLGATLKSYPVSEARAEFSRLMGLALAGEVQRVKRYDKAAVIIVSESEWEKRQLEPTAPGYQTGEIG